MEFTPFLAALVALIINCLLVHFCQNGDMSRVVDFFEEAFKSTPKHERHDNDDNSSP